MDAEIRQRLLDAEEDLLSALSDESLLLPFHSTWSKLEVDLSDMKTQGVLAEDTVALSRAVASRISTVVQCYLDVQREQESLTAELLSSGKEILAGLSRPSVTSACSAQTNRDGCVPFIALTSKWLLEHIHNPYPSPQFKASVAEACNCSQNSVNSWFVAARRRVGWTSLCREQFRNCRADAVDAAYRALVRPDPVRPLLAATIEAFLAVKANAEELYSSFTQKVHAVDLDATVNDMADHGIRRLSTEGVCQQDVCRGDAGILTCHADQRSETIYHSPFLSTPPPVSALPTLVPSLSDESDDEDQDISPPVLAGRKRRASQSDNQFTARTDLPKRLCVRPSPTPNSNASEPPSPLSEEGTMVLASLEPRTRCVMPRSRKRRLSEGAQRNIPEHPHGFPNTPRLQTVSDPFPTTTSNESDIEDWFQTNFQTFFDLPAPAECSDLDPTTQWEVLFGAYSIPFQSEPHLMHSSPGSSEAAPQSMNTQEHEGGFNGFDDLLLSLGNDTGEDIIPDMHSAALHFSPMHQFALSDGTSSLGSVPFLDDLVTFCEPIPQMESVGTPVSSELGILEFPDLLASQSRVDNQTALVIGDTGLPVGA